MFDDIDTKEEALTEAKRLRRVILGFEITIIGLITMIIYIVTNIIMSFFPFDVFNIATITVFILLINKAWREAELIELHMYILRLVFKLDEQEKESEDEKIN
jgi:hypothetical protein